MKNLMKLIQISLIVITVAITTQAQTNNELKTTTLHVGYVPVSLLSSTSFGIHIGYSKINYSPNQLVAETQISYTFSKFKGGSDIFERGQGHAQIFNGLVGARFYLAKRKSGKGNVYLNALCGLTMLEEQQIGNDGSVQAGFGYSIGLYVETKNNLNFGLAIESVATAVLKVGYSF